MTTTRKGLRAQELVLCGIFSALIAVGAFLRVPVPLVPFTLQLFFVTMAGFVLGPRLGAVSALVYVALGLWACRSSQKAAVWAMCSSRPLAI